VTLVGISLGGCLAIRAAAFEPRVRGVVAFDVLSDFFECMMAVHPGPASSIVRALLGRVVALFGFTRSRKNPNLCMRCCEALPPGGAEIDIAVLLADVRGVGPSSQLSLFVIC
jgi:hypothetical protein